MDGFSNRKNNGAKRTHTRCLCSQKPPSWKGKKKREQVITRPLSSLEHRSSSSHFPDSAPSTNTERKKKKGKKADLLSAWHRHSRQNSGWRAKCLYRPSVFLYYRRGPIFRTSIYHSRCLIDKSSNQREVGIMLCITSHWKEKKRKRYHPYRKLSAVRELKIPGGSSVRLFDDKSLKSEKESWK